MRKPRWSLYIKNFGKIRETEIEISPFMLFVGDNNTGKSYIMTLLWGIFTEGHWLLKKIEHNRELHRLVCLDELESWIGKLSPIDCFDINTELQKKLIDLFNKQLNIDKETFLSRLFNYKVEAEELKIKSFNYLDNFAISVKEDERFGEGYKSQIYEIKHDTKVVLSMGFDNGLEKELVVRHLIRLILWYMISGGIGQTYPFSEFEEEQPLYLPASRTGFMHSYKVFIQNVLKKSFEYEHNNTTEKSVKLTLPVSRFLQKLVSVDMQQGRFHDIAIFLEKELMQGEITKDSSPVPNFLYKPVHAEKELSLHVTSSLITELSPIIIMLRSQFKPKLLIIEEPEAHLHPKLQRKLAQVLTRLYNKGVYVWITTHSDTMFQQFNNLIYLSNHKNKDALCEKLSYSDEDLFKDKDEISAYQYRSLGNVTEIEKLKIQHEGFPVPTFNETIRSLSQETWELLENEEDE